MSLCSVSNTLLSTAYKDCHQKLYVCCPEGHVFLVTFNAFKDKPNGKTGTRCFICWKGKHRHSQNHIERSLKEFGYALQEQAVYTGYYQPLPVICPMGHPHQTTFARFKRGIRCKECSEHKSTYTYEEVKAYFQEKGYVLLSPKYNGANAKLDTLCPKGHPYSVRFYAFKDKKNGKSGSRCSTCCTINHKYSQEYIESFLKSYLIGGIHFHIFLFS